MLGVREVIDLGMTSDAIQDYQLTSLKTYSGEQAPPQFARPLRGMYFDKSQPYWEYIWLGTTTWLHNYIKVGEYIHMFYSGSHLMGQRQPSGTPFKNTFKFVGNV